MFVNADMRPLTPSNEEVDGCTQDWSNRSGHSYKRLGFDEGASEAGHSFDGLTDEQREIQLIDFEKDMRKWKEQNDQWVYAHNVVRPKREVVEFYRKMDIESKNITRGDE